MKRKKEKEKKRCSGSGAETARDRLPGELLEMLAALLTVIRCSEDPVMNVIEIPH